MSRMPEVVGKGGRTAACPGRRRQSKKLGRTAACPGRQRQSEKGGRTAAYAAGADFCHAAAQDVKTVAGEEHWSDRSSGPVGPVLPS